MSTPVFIDTAYAADMLRMSPDAILDLVKDGKLRPYGGRAPNYFFRSADVAALVPLSTVPADVQPPKRIKSATARVQTRLTADARWIEVSEDEIRDWAARADPARLQAARKAAEIAKQRLETVLQVIAESEQSRQDR
jgi:hypothetical protein